MTRAIRAWGAVLLLVAACALAACGGGGTDDATTGGATTAPADAPKGGTIVWAVPTDVVENDPTTSANVASWLVLGKVYEGLVGFSEDLRPTPKLATSWEQTAPTTYVFDIRRGVRFSNGREMTVDDVIGSLERVTDPRLASPWGAQLGSVRSITSPAPWQVQVELESPSSAFVGALAGVNVVVLPMKELRDGTFDIRTDQLGTGPYMVDAHSQDESWTLVRNPHYWDRELPKADTLAIRVMKEDAARVAGLKDGSVDITTFDTPDAVQLLQGQADVVTDVVDTTEMYRIDVNSTSSAFKDPRLREALALTIDRDQIGETALAGTSRPSAAVAPAFGACDASALPYATPDLERARQLVEEAGATGKTVSIIASPAYKTLPPIAQVLQQNLEATGLKVKIEQVDIGEWNTRVFAGRADFDLSLSFFGNFADPVMGLTWWGPDQAWNRAWNPPDAKLNALIEQVRATPAGAERDEQMRAACERIALDGQIIPLVTRSQIVAYRSDKLNAAIPSVEAYGDPLREIATYSVKAG